MAVDKSIGLGLSKCTVFSNGLEIEENNGLEFENRKRMRSGTETNNIMDVEGVLSGKETHGDMSLNKETIFSESDYIVTTTSELATLAVQASQGL